MIFFSADLYNQDEQLESLLSKCIRFAGQVLVLGGYLKNQLSSFSALFLLITNILLFCLLRFCGLKKKNVTKQAQQINITGKSECNRISYRYPPLFALVTVVKT